MDKIFLALLRTLANLRKGRIWAFLLAPAAISFLLGLGLSIWGLRALADGLLAYPPLTFLAAWGLLWLAHLLAWLGGWMLIFACAYLSASLLAALFVMPLLIKHLAAGEYRDVAPMGADSLLAATLNSLLASLLFVSGWLLTLPLWLIPGMALVLPMLLMAWYNRRTFAYDALSLHATEEEWKRLRRSERRPLFLLGLIMALLAHVPLFGLLVPTLAALAYLHYGLESLRRSRGGALLTGEARRIVE